MKEKNFWAATNKKQTDIKHKSAKLYSMCVFFFGGGGGLIILAVNNFSLR